MITFIERCSAPQPLLNGHVECEQDDLKKGVSCFYGCKIGKYKISKHFKTCRDK